jgi:hypothetical protein
MMRAAFASVDLTPGTPIALCGFADRRQCNIAVGSGIEVNAGVLRQGRRRVVLVTGDFLYMPGSLRERLVRSFVDEYGISAADVLLAPSNTHFAPALDKSKPHLGDVDDAYLHFLEERVEALVGRLLQSPGEVVTVRHHRLVSRHNINGRVVKIDAEGLKIVDAARCDPGGPCDPGLDVLRFDSETGALRGVLVRYSCRPICLPDRQELNAEFPGAIRRKMREDAELADLPVLYMQGYAAELKPEANRFRAGGLTSSPEVSLEPVAVPEFSRAVWERWAGSIATDAAAALAAAADGPALTPSLASAERTERLSNLIDDLPTDCRHLELSLQAIVIAADLLIVAISAECSSAWADVIGDMAPDKLVIPVGGANQVSVYLPGAREVTQDGWEPRALLAPLGLAGRFRTGFADTILVAAAALLAPFVEAAPAAYHERFALLRRRIDKLWAERDEARARMIQSRSLQMASKGQLAAAFERAENLQEAAAHLRRLLNDATARIDELERRLSPPEGGSAEADG